jgi:diguanylate cyclase (GGDEF)-like protein
MTAALIPILFIEIALIIMYFSINNYISEKVSRAFVSQSQHSIINLVSKEAEIINNHFLEVERSALSLQDEHQAFFSKLDSMPLTGGYGIFKTHANGVFYKAVDNGGSALYYSSDTVMGEREKKKALLSERLDESFKYLVSHNPLIAQVYINTFDNMNRIYPFIKDIPNQYGPDLKMEDYNFYYEADLMHNPLKKPVWTSAYLDPAGMGWLISCIVPIYRGGFLEGVTGMDITVAKLIDHILNLNLPNESKAFMVDENGMILAMGEDIEKLLDLHELKEHAYDKTIDMTIYKPERYNLYQHPDPETRQTLTSIFGGNVEYSETSIKGHEYFVVNRMIPQTGWHLIVVTDMDQLVEPIIDLKDMSFKIGMIAVIVMFGFYLCFFFYFKRLSTKLSEMISAPIVSLSEDTKYVGTEFFAYDYDDSEIIEIQQLNENFEDMTNQLEKRTKELVRAEVEKLESEQEAEKLLLISITDPLTKLYNRLKVDEILDYEVEQANRYGKKLSVVMGDIDHFKRVNDIFGHQKGDEVLKAFAGILAENTRSSDTVARWGGEEFLIVFTNTASEEAFGIAEKLRVLISEYDFGVNDKMTASFGVAQFKDGETKESLIHRADEALYEAKRLSRNLVVKK